MMAANRVWSEDWDARTTREPRTSRGGGMLGILWRFGQETRAGPLPSPHNLCLLLALVSRRAERQMTTRSNTEWVYDGSNTKRIKCYEF